MKIQDSNDLIESELSEELHLPEQSHVMQEVASISVVAPRPRGNQGHFRIPMGKKVFNPVTNEWIEKQIGASSTPPETLPAFQALHWQVGAMGVDLRPHVYDGVLKKWCLLDTGSQCTAWPPDPGDKVQPEIKLKAVNGSNIDCYGFKDIVIRLGRKEYRFKAIKANVSSPVLGWDFVRHYKLDFVWNEFGDITIQDRKAKIKQVLNFKSLPVEQSLSQKKLRLSPPSGATGIAALELEAQIAAILDLGEPDQMVELLPEGPYKQLLLKHPEVTKQKFNSEDAKNGIKHRINTKEGPPVKAKVRRLLPGSPKEVMAKKAWFQLIDLGIVEKVDKATANTFCSPVHFVPKADGTLRPTGDFRQLNERTELDQFPLPQVRDCTHKVKGCTVFSKVDMFKAFHQIVIDPRDRHKTCVTTPWGLFNFKRLAMGLRNSAQSFQRLLQDILGDMENIFFYLDDIFIYNKTQEEHLDTLEELFTRLETAGLSISLDKCVFGQPVIDFLGYTISSSGLKPIAKKVEALQNFPPPEKQKDLLGFLGALNYY